MAQIRVVLDNYRHNYKPNDIIEGKVVCNLNSSRTVEGLKLCIRGFEHTSWMDYDSEDKTRYTAFIGNRDFLNSEIRLNDQFTDSGTMAAGNYIYRFKIRLPRSLPSTYICESGYIRFTIKAVIDRNGQLDLENEVIYVVSSPIALDSTLRTYLGPGAWADDKTVSSCFSTPGPIELNVSVPTRAYIPGQRIILTVKVRNLSNIDVKQVTAQLQQCFTYIVKYPQTKTRPSVNIISAIRAPGIVAHEENEFHMVLDIPNDTIVPNFTGCTLFKVRYKVKVICELPGFHKNLKLDITNIQLGNIQSTNEGNRSPARNYQASAPEPEPGASAPEPGASVPICSPPSAPESEHTDPPLYFELPQLAASPPPSYSSLFPSPEGRSIGFVRSKLSPSPALASNSTTNPTSPLTPQEPIDPRELPNVPSTGAEDGLSENASGNDPPERSSTRRKRQLRKQAALEAS